MTTTKVHALDLRQALKEWGEIKHVYEGLNNPIT